MLIRSKAVKKENPFMLSTDSFVKLRTSSG
jgi:hypothetical protein